MKLKFKPLSIENYSKSEILDDNEIESKYGSKIDTILKQVFKHESFRYPQREIILKFIGKRDVFVLMPTGGGKSLNYQLSSLVFPGITVVICPLIALMQNQVNSLKRLGIPCAFINSNLKPSERDVVIREIQKFEPSIRLLYVTPELIQTGFLSVLKRVYSNKNLSSFVVDEAHAVSLWGHDFRPAYVNLSVLKSNFPQIPIMACTATATEKVQLDIIKILGLVDACKFFNSFNRPNIIYSIRYKKCIPDLLLDIRNTVNGFLMRDESCGIIYCHKRSECDELSENLNAYGIKTAAYHAGLKNNDRKSILDDWMNQKIQIVIATIAFGMGIDNPKVGFVIHYTIPKSLEDYYQESGRAGRDGRRSSAILYYSREDGNMRRFLSVRSYSKRVNPSESKCEVDKVLKLIEFCESASCRRASLLSYFGERVENANICNKTCDYCSDPKGVISRINDLRKQGSVCTGDIGMKRGVITDVEEEEEEERFDPFCHNKRDDDWAEGCSIADMWKRPFSKRSKAPNADKMSPRFKSASELIKKKC